MDKQEKAATIVGLVGIFGILLWALFRRSPQNVSTVGIRDASGNLIQESKPGDYGIFTPEIIKPPLAPTISLTPEPNYILGPAIENPFNRTFNCPVGYKIVNDYTGKYGVPICVRIE